MRNDLFSRILFAVAALYDGLLGLIFLFAGGAMFRHFSVPPPNHWGYVQFPAAILIIFGLMFVSVAINPARNRNLIPFGCLLKVAYSGVVFLHWFSHGIPDLWKPFAFADAVFLILFLIAYTRLGGAESAPAS